ncbi:hypothetical protein EVAR_37769_1 [Eumeta japonica]|uniref:Uncharacterized protein n=1 Tax=Eumeta variegata TaxID=151549 RepID=A0A4C1WM66_EUMVA|nr:hypothetical protein EVAR_37769_1 [Eumeta japonica]
MSTLREFAHTRTHTLSRPLEFADPFNGARGGGHFGPQVRAFGYAALHESLRAAAGRKFINPNISIRCRAVGWHLMNLFFATDDRPSHSATYGRCGYGEFLLE